MCCCIRHSLDQVHSAGWSDWLLLMRSTTLKQYDRKINYLLVVIHYIELSVDLACLDTQGRHVWLLQLQHNIIKGVYSFLGCNLSSSWCLEVFHIILNLKKRKEMCTRFAHLTFDLWPSPMNLTLIWYPPIWHHCHNRQTNSNKHMMSKMLHRRCRV